MGFRTNNELSKFFSCCKDCTKRNVTCHDTCEEYLNGKKLLAEYKKKKEMEKDIITKRHLKYMGRRQL